MYYLRQRTQISGPFTVEQLTSLLHRGRVARSDKISTDKVTWMPIADCAEIARQPAAPVQPTPAEAQPAVAEWFYTVLGAEQADPVTAARLGELIAAGTVGAGEMVWRQGFAEWQALSTVAEFGEALAAARPGGGGMPAVDLLPPIVVTTPAAPQAAAGAPDYQAFVGKKVAAGVAALLLGPLGIHKFILGLTTGGVTMLLLCLLVVPIPFLSIAALVEGILYLTKSDDAFYRDYAVARKQWF